MKRNGPVVVTRPSNKHVDDVVRSIPHVPRGQSVQTPRSSVETSVVVVTPSMAAEWLERGGINRPTTQSYIDRYARDMKAGEWRLTGESIKLDRQGRVRDGQHRLFACIEAGVPFETCVTINVDEEAFDVMDSGKLRTAGDMLSLHGFTSTSGLAAMAKASLIWEHYGNLVYNSRATPSKPAMLAWLENNPDAVTWLRHAERVRKAGYPGGPGPWSTVLYRLSRVDEQATLQFIDKLITGVNLDNGSPILALRNRLFASRQHGGRIEINELAALILKAWNAWRSGRMLTVLVWRHHGDSPESFPVPE
jgi:hypothetical protein